LNLQEVSKPRKILGELELEYRAQMTTDPKTFAEDVLKGNIMVILTAFEY